MQHGMDRRGGPRHELGPGPGVEVAADGVRVRGVARDVSIGGLFVVCAPEAAQRIAPGTDCAVVLTFGSGRRAQAVHLHGRIARTGPDGVAVETTYLDADNHARLHERLSSDAQPVDE